MRHYAICNGILEFKVEELVEILLVEVLPAIRSKCLLELIPWYRVCIGPKHVLIEPVDHRLKDHFIHAHFLPQKLKVKLLVLLRGSHLSFSHVEKYSGYICQEEDRHADVLIGDHNTML